MIRKEELLALSYSFLSYVLRDPSIVGKLKRIFLFGSVARGEFDESSDIDLFFDVEKKDEAVVKKIVNRAMKKFYSSDEWRKWRLRGIENELKPNIGYLEEWGLKTSIEKEGILLYSISPTAKLVKYFLITFKAIKPISKRVRVIRTLYGRKEYKEAGLVKKYAGKIITPRAFIIKAEGLNEITSLLAKEKIEYSIEEFWMA